MYSSTQPSHFWRRLGRSAWWIFRTTVVVLILISLAIGLAAGSLYVVWEVQRSFASLALRLDASEQNWALLRSDVNTFMAHDREQQQQIRSLHSEVGQFNTRLAGWEDQMKADLNRQEPVLATLAASVTSASQDTAAIATGLAALQNDLNEQSRRIDSLGGEIDELRSSLATSQAEVDELRQVTDAIAAETDSEAAFAETLVLFHVWQLITRARFRLVENNVGLAAADTVLALRAVNAILAANPEAVMPALETVQTRLELALSSLPSSPTTAVSDLEGAWDELDAILVARLWTESANEATFSIESTPSPVASPLATVLPSPTPTLPPTPTP